MRNFHETRGKYFFDLDKYLDAWEKCLGIKTQNLQSLSSHIRTLWNQFNTDRSTLDKYYMDTILGQKAYLASFLFPNAERVFSLLSSEENQFALANLFQDAPEEFRIADFGAGPLSASVGAISCIEELLDKYPDKAPKKIIIYAIERSEKICETGATLLQKALFEKNSIEVIRLSSVEKIPQTVDLALAVNIFNEIPEKHRAKTLQVLFSKLQPKGLCLIVEPGQTIHAKKLGSLRDAFLAKEPNCDVISPCSHTKNCPLSFEAERKDWCWFRHAWNPPEALKFLDKHSKIDHHVLNYSYLFLQKEKLAPEHTYYARCVSDPMPMEDKTKFLLCTQSGAIKPLMLNTDPEIPPPYVRGSKVTHVT